MHDEETHPNQQAPAEMLAAVSRASACMITASDAPKEFYPILVALIATILSLRFAAPLTVLLGLLTLLLPLGAWYFLWTRHRAKPRALLNASGAHGGYFLLILLFITAAGFWEARTGWDIAAKWIICFAVSLFAQSKMRSSMAASRHKDAVENAN